MDHQQGHPKQKLEVKGVSVWDTGDTGKE